MASITLRSAVGRPLTNSEVDANFSALNLELGQKLVASLNLLDLPNPAQARSNLGLGNVENKSSATIRGELTSGNVTSALGYTPLSTAGGTLTGVLAGTDIRSFGQIRATGWWNTNSGSYNGLGVEIGVSGGQGFILTYNRDTNSYGSLEFNASSIRLVPQGGSLTGPGGNALLHAGNYSSYALPLSGGQLSGNLFIATTSPALVLRDTNNSGSGAGQMGYISLQDSGGVERGWFGYGSEGTTDFNISNSRGGFTFNASPVLNSGNFSNYALPLSGGALTGQLSTSSNAPFWFTGIGNGTYNVGAMYVNSSNMVFEAPIQTDSQNGTKVPFIITWRGGYASQGGLRLTGYSSGEIGGYTILHGGNFSSFSVPISGGTMTGDLYLQNGYYRAPFYSFIYSANHSAHIHLKTNRRTNESQMHSVIFEGYDYGAQRPILAAVGWYNYGGVDNAISVGSSGSHGLSVYRSSDGYAVIVLQSTGGYYTGFNLHQAVTAQGLSPITISGYAFSTSTTGVY